MNANNLCPGCMNEIPDIKNKKFCPKCGCDLSFPDWHNHQLKPYSILNGKYMVGKVLGEGGFGITYLGIDLTLEIPVAIKEYYPNGLVQRDCSGTDNTIHPFNKSMDEFNKWRERFLTEARTLAKFSNKEGIVSVREFFQENNTAYIAMEYLDGISLKSYLKANGDKIPVQNVLNYMEPIIKALSDVHAAGIIHRDISPDNIMILKNGRLKLLDFGAARAFAGDDEKSKSVLLKHGYAPEEQYRTRGNQGPWTDVYALCATMYRCITGQKPIEAMERLRSDEMKMPGELGILAPQNVENALRKGLAVYGKDRFQDMTQLYSALYQGVVVDTSDITVPLQPEHGGQPAPQPAPLPQMPPVYATPAGSGNTMAGYTMTGKTMAQGEYTVTSGSGMSQGANKPLIIVVAVAAISVVIVTAIASITMIGGGGRSRSVQGTPVMENDYEEEWEGDGEEGMTVSAAGNPEEEGDRLYEKWENYSEGKEADAIEGLEKAIGYYEQIEDFDLANRKIQETMDVYEDAVRDYANIRLNDLRADDVKPPREKADTVDGGDPDSIDDTVMHYYQEAYRAYEDGNGLAARLSESGYGISGDLFDSEKNKLPETFKDIMFEKFEREANKTESYLVPGAGIETLNYAGGRRELLAMCMDVKSVCEGTGYYDENDPDDPVNLRFAYALSRYRRQTFEDGAVFDENAYWNIVDHMEDYDYDAYLIREMEGLALMNGLTDVYNPYFGLPSSHYRELVDSSLDVEDIEDMIYSGRCGAADLRYARLAIYAKHGMFTGEDFVDSRTGSSYDIYYGMFKSYNTENHDKFVSSDNPYGGLSEGERHNIRAIVQAAINTGNFIL